MGAAGSKQLPQEPLIFSFLVYKKETKLHMIRVRFGTFSVDRITKSLKANLIDKLSHFGGTAGLFNGFAIISVFEFLAFGVSLLVGFYKSYIKKDKSSSGIEAQVFESTEYKNIHEDIRNNLLAKKLEAMETELNTYRHQMIESNQMFEEFEKNVNEKMELKKAPNMDNGY